MSEQQEYIDKDNAARDLVVPDPANPSEATFPQDREEPAQRAAPEEPAEAYGPYADKRARLYAKAEQQREEHEAQFGIQALPDEVERGRVPANTETFADRQARRQADETQDLGPDPAAPQNQPPAPKMMRVKVNGVEREIPEEEFMAAGMKALAANDVLEDAKRQRAAILNQTLAEAQQIKMASQHPDQQPGRPSASNATEDAKPVAAELDDVVEAIQLGGTEDAKNALQRFGETVVRQALSAIDVDGRIAEREATNYVQRQISESVGTFEDLNPAFKNPTAQRALAFEAYDVMESNLTSVGVPAELFDAIAQRDGIPREIAVRNAYREAMKRGLEVPRYDEVLFSAADRMSQAMGLPKAVRQRPASPQPEPSRQSASDFAQQREQRKLATAQPTRSTVPPGIAPQNALNEDDRRRQAIREMRSGRTTR